jgi:energy-coupling factor transporter ATP-binding protein EcfA2
MTQNPYKYTGPLDPVEDKLVCVPRQKDVRRVVDGINRGDYWSVLGPLNIGKTTFLRQIPHAYPNAYYLYLNFSSSPEDEKNFYSWIIREFLNNIPHNGKYDRSLRKKDSSPVLAFFDFLKRFKAKEEKKIILLCDDIENTTFINSFLLIWRNVDQTRYHDKKLNKFVIILAGTKDPIRLTIGPHSPYNIGEWLYLEDFSDEEAEGLVEKPFKKLNIKIDVNAKKKLLHRLAGHPQLLQQSCYFLVQRALDKDNKSILTVNDVNDALDDLMVNNSHLKVLHQEVNENKELRILIRDILAGKVKPFHPFREFSIIGTGTIRETPKSNCTIRNPIYKTFLKKLLKQPEEEFPAKKPKKKIPAKEKLLIKKISRDDEYIDEKIKKPMPRALKQLQVRNYYGIIKTGVHLPLDAKWIFLTGENAFGKTAVLRALAIGLLGPRDEETILLVPESSSRIAVEIHNNGKTIINDVGTSKFKSFTYFAAYGPSRLEIQSERGKNEITEKSTKSYSLFNDDGISLNIERELVLWYLDNDPKFETVKKILLQLLPHGADIIVDRKKKEVYYIEKENGNAFESSPFNQLAAGNKSIIAMIGDLILRFYKEYEPVEIEPVNFEGIVIIDELDVHLHPRWLRQLPKILSDLFPKIQFIASTHSEIPILGAPKQSALLKVTRTREQGIQIHRINVDFKNLLPHHLLTSPIFGMDQGIIPEANERLSDLRTGENYYKSLETGEIMKDLHQFEESDRDYPDELFD